MKKIKLLFDTETTGALSGFGKYGRELLKRLVQDERFEIAEFASFGTMNDNKFAHVTWKYYPNAVDGNHPESKMYESDVRNKYGAWRFDRVCLDFQPDFVISWKDPWMMEHLFLSPLRPFYHLAVMPTVDSAPQQPQWIEMFRDADSIFTYSDWAIPVLQKQSGGDIQPVCSTYPGVDLELFRPMDRSKMREAFGIPKDAFIIGMVCRNQRRKLLPELFKMFRIYLDKYGNTEIGKKTYLYLHTSYPDVGWDLPELLNEFGLTSRVYFTYYCHVSRQPIVMKFEGARTFSHLSQNLTAQFPNVGSGLTEEQLGYIYNLFDLYIQYANCEGSGMPVLEAAACGIPISAVNYSAMADSVEKSYGIPLIPASIPRDADLQADRAVPDNDFTADAIYKFVMLDKNLKDKKSKAARKAAETYFNWDRTAKLWTDHFVNTKLTKLQGKWDSPVQIDNQHIPDKPIENVSHTHFIQWCSVFAAKTPILAAKYFGLNWLNILNNGGSIHGPVGRQQVFEQFKNIGQHKIQCEMARLNVDKLPPADFIEFAHILYKENNE